jgi:hypothetical protein
MYCCSECRKTAYYDGIMMNKPKYKMTKALRKELESDIIYILNPNARANGFLYKEFLNRYKELGLVNENSLKKHLKLHGFKIKNEMIIKNALAANPPNP